MRNKKFYDLQHAMDYLTGSIIRVNDVPVHVVAVGDAGIIYRPVNDKKTTKDIPLDDPAVDFNPLPLGFLSIRDHTEFKTTAYLKRGPMRQWKIGLTSRNCYVANPFRTGIGHVPYSQHALYSDAMVRTVANQYIDPEAAQTLSKAMEGSAAAFGRRFAVFSDYLLFKDLGEPVGTVINGKPELHDDFTYLTELLKEDLNACGHC